MDLIIIFPKPYSIYLRATITLNLLLGGDSTQRVEVGFIRLSGEGWCRANGIWGCHTVNGLGFMV